MKINLIIKCFAVGSLVALYLIIIGAYISSYSHEFTFCVANNIYGEFWVELVMFIFFGTFTTIWMIKTLENEKDE